MKEELAVEEFYMGKKISERVYIDDEADYLVIDGIRFSGVMITETLKPSPVGHWYRILDVSNGAVVIETRIADDSRT